MSPAAPESVMPRLVLALLCCMLILTAADGQEAALELKRVTGNDGKPWPIKVSRRGLTPEIETFDAPYVLTPGTPKPALWFLDGAECVPVTYTPKGKRLAGFEIVRSGAEFFLTYVVDGANEFWCLQGDKASQVMLDEKPFSQRARITRGGAHAYIYQGEFDGSARLYRLDAGTAVAVEIADKQDRGTLSFAWQVGEQLLCAFYLGGTYDFYLFKDGKFTPAWEHNGEQTYESQVDTITEYRAAGTLFLNITRRDKSCAPWRLDASGLRSLSAFKKPPDWNEQPPVCNGRGAHFIVEGRVFLAGANSVADVTTGSLIVTSLSGAGGGVLAIGKDEAWLLSGSSVTKLPEAEYDWIISLGDIDILRAKDGTIRRYREGLAVAGEFAPSGMPADFGVPRESWPAAEGRYLLEFAATEAPEYRLWLLR